MLARFVKLNPDQHTAQIHYSTETPLLAITSLYQLNDFFLELFKATLTIIVAVYIDETITFFHFTSSGRNKIDTTPGCVSSKFYTIFIDGIPHGINVGCQVVNTIIVFNITIFIWCIHSTNPILNDKHRFLVTIPNSIEGNTKA